MRRIIVGIAWILMLIAEPVQASRMPDSFAPLVERSMPAVVNISTKQQLQGKQMLQDFYFGPGKPFEGFREFFEQFNQGLNPEGDNDTEQNGRKVTSLGSGFIIDKKGFVVTNNHVIADADEVMVTLSDDMQYEAKIIGRDEKTDLALLKIDRKEDFPYIEFGDSDDARVGDWVVTIGNPFGLGGTVTAGIISARARDINVGPFDDFIQTDAAVNRGNSGGPLFNVDGEVIGINSAIYSPSGGNVGIAFAIPTALATPVLKQLREVGHVRRGWLGVKIQVVSEEVADSLGLKKTMGALVAEVTPDTPAEKAGIEAGDVILEFDGRDVKTMRKLPRMVAETKIGKHVKIVVFRKGKKHTLEVNLGELEEVKTSSSDKKLESSSKNQTIKTQEILSLEIAEITPYITNKYDIKEGLLGVVIIKVKPDSEAANRGLRQGDVITMVNQDPVRSINDIKMQVAKAKKEKKSYVMLLITRSDETLFVSLPTK